MLHIDTIMHKYSDFQDPHVRKPFFFKGNTNIHLAYTYKQRNAQFGMQDHNHISIFKVDSVSQKRGRSRRLSAYRGKSIFRYFLLYIILYFDTLMPSGRINTFIFAPTSRSATNLYANKGPSFGSQIAQKVSAQRKRAQAWG